MLAKLFVKFTFACKLKHQEDAFLVVEVPIKTEYIWVSQVLLNFDFAADLLLDIGMNNFRFVEGLESEDVPWFALCADHIDTTEFTLAEWTSHVEVMEAPFSGW
jgi:hypothetical protein